jgi:hypothetical protein
MTRKPGDPTPEPPGGRAAERLKQFEDARGEDINPPIAPKKRETVKSPKASERQKKR